MNITCPHCKLEHALFWFVPSQGHRELSYRCDRFKTLRLSQKVVNIDGEHIQELKTINSRFIVEDVEILKQAKKQKLSEVWSKKLIKKNQSKAQMNLPI